MANYDDTATVSGSVVSIENGADEVGAKSCVVTVSPTLSGVSSVTETQTGKNLLKVTGSAVSGDLTVTPQTDGTVVVNGQRSTALTWTAGQFVAKGACSIVFSGCSGGSGSTYSVNIQKNNVYQADVYNGDSTVYNLVQGDVIKFIVVVRANVSMSNVVFSPMIRFSVDTDGTFEKYTETQYTASLGRTIYGGTADVVKGEGQETHGKKVFDGTEGTGGTPSWTMISVSQGTMFRITVSDKTTTSATNTRCSYYTPVAQAQRADGTVSGAGTNVDIIDNRFSSVDDFKAWLAENPVTLVYELATPTDFTFTPISPTPETALGVNNFWAEQGNTELTYYKDGYGVTSVTVHKETPEGEPVEETRKFHRIIYEGQVDVISGTGLINIGESGTEYDPPEQISFTPVEIATDEGENTFYADEGVSVITYRREVE